MIGLLLGFMCLSLAQAASWPDISSPPSSTGGGSKDAAVVVGIEDYAFVADIPGAKANAEAWYSWLVRTHGVPADRVRLLRDAEATDLTLREAMKAATSRVQAGGTLWFVFIGHGAPSSDGRDGLLVGADAQQTAIGIQGRSIPRSELLSTLEFGPQASTVVVLDTCFSGRSPNGQMLVGDLQPVIPVWAAMSTRATVMSAARGDQFAGPLPGTGRPAYSYLVLGALRGWGDANADGQVTIREAADYASGALFATVKDRKQEPEIAGPSSQVLAKGRERGPDLASLVLTAPSSSSSAPSPAITGTGGGFSSSLDVESALAEQRCMEEGRTKAERAVSDRIGSAVAGRRQEATDSWRRLRVQAEACTALDRQQDRAPCLEALDDFVSWAEDLGVEQKAGFEEVKTACGSRRIPVEASRQAVAVPEVEEAKALKERIAAMGGGGTTIEVHAGRGLLWSGAGLVIAGTAGILVGRWTYEQAYGAEDLSTAEKWASANHAADIGGTGLAVLGTGLVIGGVVRGQW